MRNPPQIWLDYRPVRIGWVLDGRSLEQLATAAYWNSCLWGGCFNPLLPSDDTELSNYLIPTFGVDVLIAVAPSETTKAFVAQYPNLQMDLRRHPLFNDRRCEFADIRHAVSRAALQTTRNVLPSVLQPLWSQDDPLAVLLSVLFGRYPELNVVGINYLRGIRTFLEMEDKPIVRDGELPAAVATSITPINLTSFSLSWRRDFDSDFWLSPGIIFGEATDFDDLILFWNLRAAGAKVWFFDPTEPSNRLGSSLEAFLAALREVPQGGSNHLNLWCRSMERLPQWMSELDLSGFALARCPANAQDWNGHNIRPGRPKFSFWHRDVVPSYAENDEGAVVSFAIPDQPFDPDDPASLGQRFVVTVEASPFGRVAGDWTFNTSYLQRLNNFYSEKLCFGLKEIRSEPGHHGRGAIGIITTVGDQRMELSAISVHDWIQEFFGFFGINVKRSEPGLPVPALFTSWMGFKDVVS
jgi:hypothetical protein